MPAGYYHSLLIGSSGPRGGSLDFYNAVGGTSLHPYVILGAGSLFAAPPAECTVQGWMKQLHTYSGEGVLICCDSINFMLGYIASGSFFQLFGGGVNSTFTATGGWDHVTYVRSVVGNTQKFYLNGVIQNTIATSTLPRTMAGTDRRIGGDGGGDSFQGLISDLRVWNIARTGPQILADYNKRLTGSESGLIGYWQLNEGTGVTVADLTSNANTGTFFGQSFGVPGTDCPTWSADTPPFV